MKHILDLASIVDGLGRLQCAALLEGVEEVINKDADDFELQCIHVYEKIARRVL
jgi:hypothetical protein